MKKVTLVFALLFSIVIQAQQSVEFKNETIEFIKMTGAGATFDQAIAQIGSTVPETNKAKYLEEANKTLDGLYGKMADLYMAEFSQDEIKELSAFYKTDLGKKLANKQLELTQKAMQFGQSWGMEVGAIAQKYNM